MIKNKKTLIIAEAGVNHNGSIVMAKKLVDAACRIGVDIIKFQIYRTDQLIIKKTPMANYQKINLDIAKTQYAMLKDYELSEKNFKTIIDYCKFKRIKFLASAFDISSIKILNKFKVTTFKIPSGEITNYEYLKFLGGLNKKIIISSGMSNIKEVKEAINLLIYNGTKKDNITVMHCNTDYPTKISDVNMRAMLTIKDTLKVNIGYSDHSNNIEVPIIAASLGASIIEKHFTLNKKLKGPDHKASLEPKSFKQMIENIRNTEIILGSAVKIVTKSEKKNIISVRKSLVAKKTIQKGEVIKAEYITAKRPGNGINPMQIKKVIGSISKKKFLKDEQIKF